MRGLRLCRLHRHFLIHVDLYAEVIAMFCVQHGWLWWLESVGLGRLFAALLFAGTEEEIVVVGEQALAFELVVLASEWVISLLAGLEALTLLPWAIT